MLEKDIIRKTCAWVRLAYGSEAKCVKIHGGPFMENGLPDLFILVRGRFIAAEAKQPGKRPSPIQMRRLQEFRDAGALAFWFDDVETFKSLVTDFLATPREPSSGPWGQAVR